MPASRSLEKRVFSPTDLLSSPLQSQKMKGPSCVSHDSVILPGSPQSSAIISVTPHKSPLSGQGSSTPPHSAILLPEPTLCPQYWLRGEHLTPSLAN